jgi:hypothetical protein
VSGGQTQELMHTKHTLYITELHFQFPGDVFIKGIFQQPELSSNLSRLFTNSLLKKREVLPGDSGSCL